MYNLIKSGIVILFCLIGLNGNGQKSLIKQANTLYQNGHYQKALDFYTGYNKLDRKPKMILTKAICEYELGYVRESIKSLNLALDKSKNLHKAFYYLGQCHVDLKEYKIASDFYKRYLSLVRLDINKSERDDVITKIKRCEFGTRLGFSPQYAFVENMGSTVNTEFDEITPIQSPNFRSKFYFSSNRDIASGGRRDKQGLKNDFIGHYYFDMFAVELINGNWTSVYPFNEIQNTSKHEILKGFNSDGSIMYYQKGDQPYKGEILVDTFGVSVEKRAFPDQFVSTVFGSIGDKDLYFFKDDIILFSSKRDGGYGGYDIYISEFKDSIWTAPQNLGPTINSEYDDNSPYLSKGGNELYFSSNRLQGFGGYDLYKSTYNSNSWENAINLGLPINSPRDEKDIYLTFDGTQAIYSSNRPDGNGGFDLYLIYWKDQVYDQLAYTESLPFLSVDNEASNDSDSLLTIATTTSPKDEIIVEQSDFINADIYYDPNIDILTPQNRVVLNNLDGLMKVYPEIKVCFYAHANAKNLKSFDLFFGVKRAEIIKSYLVEKGIDSDRINIISLGSSYPIVGNPSLQVADQLHHRIDIRLFNVNEQRLNIVYNDPVVNDDLRSPLGTKYFDGIDKIRFRIKVAKTSQMLRGNILLSHDPFLVELESDRLVYYQGDFTSYDQANAKKISLLQSGITENAEIIPFLNHQSLDRNQQFALKDQYPNLLRYIEEGK